MGTLQVSNVHFESTANNRIEYAGSNTVNIYAGGTNVLSANSSTMNIPVAGSISIGNSTVNTAITSTGISQNGDNISPVQSFRNKIINGNFDYWQRGTTFSNPSSFSYTADRWQVAYDGTGATRTIDRQSFTLGQTDVPNEPTYFLRHNQSVAGSGGTYNAFGQLIESVRTLAGQTATLTFWAKASASITLPSILQQQAFGTGGSPSTAVAGTIASNVSVGTSWTKYTYSFSVPSISGKTLGTNNNDSFGFYIFLPINNTFTFDIAQVQLEAGSVATPFEMRPLGTELALCQRYYQTGYMRVRGTLVSGSIECSSQLPVTMRATPTMTGTGVGSLGENTIYINSTSSASGNVPFTADAEL